MRTYTHETPDSPSGMMPTCVDASLYGTSPAELAEIFRLLNEPVWFSRYNIAPTQSVVVVRPDVQFRTPSLMRWGLIPSWAKDEKDWLSADQCASGNDRREAVIPGRLQTSPLPDPRRWILRVAENR